MSRHTFKVHQVLPVSVNDAWNFFSDPSNLQLITPANFQFKVLTDVDGKSIYPGQIIEYRVRPLYNIPIHWTTLITKVDEQVMFIDEQIRGPYRYWQDQHFFKPVNGGTEMTDIVTYEVPGWFAGNILNRFLIRKKLKELFDFRYDAIKIRFG